MNERMTNDALSEDVRKGASSPACEPVSSSEKTEVLGNSASSESPVASAESAVSGAASKIAAASPRGLLRGARGHSVVVFSFVAIVWLAFDMLTKAFFNTFEVGELIGGPYLGLFEFRLVHNTGAAWGMFGDSTFALGVLSVVVCAMLIAFLLLVDPPLNSVCTVGLALVFAGGVGNAIDRFSQAYVVDFINATFIDFPVFNIADIGVTCGFALLFVGFFIAERASSACDEERS